MGFSVAELILLVETTLMGSETVAGTDAELFGEEGWFSESGGL